MAKTNRNKKPVVPPIVIPEKTKEESTQEMFGLSKDSPMFAKIEKVETSKLNGSWGQRKK